MKNVLISANRISLFLIMLLLGLWAVDFALTYPNSVTVSDESDYLLEAHRLSDAFSHRIGTVDMAGIVPYPIGNALLLAPAIGLGGWRAGFVIPALCFLVLAWTVARLLWNEGLDPVFATLLFLFPPTLVMARVAMSDIPSAMLIALFLYLLSFQQIGGRGRWLWAGFIGGASICFRETNILLVFPFALGALMRRESGAWRLLTGFVGGVSLRLIAHWFIWGSPFAYKDPNIPFTISALYSGLPSLMLVPLVGVTLFYRGYRRIEVITCTCVFFTFYNAYAYKGDLSGFLKGVVLGGRFFLPLLPILCYACAHVLREWWRVAYTWHRWLGFEVAAASCALVLCVNSYMGRWTNAQAQVRHAIYAATADRSTIVTDIMATGKFINELYAPRKIVDVHHCNLDPSMEREFYIAFLDRGDSELWRRVAELNEHCRAQLGGSQHLLLDSKITNSDRLRIWVVRRQPFS